MKKQISRSVAMLGLLLTLAVATVQAQTGMRVVVHVPFDFIVGESRLAAGNYTVSEVNQHALYVRSADGETALLIQAPRTAIGDGQAKERLVFRRYGDQYFLAQAYLHESGNGSEVRRSDAERSLIRKIEVAGLKALPQTVEVAANGR